jgi:hypothetical protein
VDWRVSRSRAPAESYWCRSCRGCPAILAAMTRADQRDQFGRWTAFQCKFAISLTANPIEVIPVANPARTRRGSEDANGIAAKIWTLAVEGGKSLPVSITRTSRGVEEMTTVQHKFRFTGLCFTS